MTDKEFWKSAGLSEHTWKLFQESEEIEKKLKGLACGMSLKDLEIAAGLGIGAVLDGSQAAALLQAEQERKLREASTLESMVEKSLGVSSAMEEARKAVVALASQRSIEPPDVFEIDSTPFTPSPNFFRPDPDHPIAKTAEGVAELNKKFDHSASEATDILRTMAALHAKTNEAIRSGLADQALKRAQDEKSATQALLWAVAGIFISVFISCGSILQSYWANQDGDKHQAKIEGLMAQQRDFLKSLSQSQTGTDKVPDVQAKKLERPANRKNP